jgi:UDP-glucuronate 4-epimerase
LKVLVTGAAGFIAGHLCEELLNSGAEVLGVDCLDPYYDLSIKRERLARLEKRSAFKWIEGDLANPDIVDACLKSGVETVFHLAARPGVRASLEDPAGTFDRNVMATIQLLQGMVKQHVHRLVFASSSSVYGGEAKPPFRETDAGESPLSPYAASKRAVELLLNCYIRNYPLAAISLRFFTVYGPFGRPDMAIGKFSEYLFKNKEAPLYGTGEAIRDFTYVSDTVAGILLAAKHLKEGTHQIFNLGGGNRCSLKRVIDLLEEYSGRTLKLKRLPPFSSDMMVTQACPDKAHKQLGWQPKVSIEEGLSRTIEWAAQHYEGPCADS